MKGETSLGARLYVVSKNDAGCYTRLMDDSGLKVAILPVVLVLLVLTRCRIFLFSVVTLFDVSGWLPRGLRRRQPGADGCTRPGTGLMPPATRLARCTAPASLFPTSS